MRAWSARLNRHQHIDGRDTTIASHGDGEVHHGLGPSPFDAVGDRPRPHGLTYLRHAQSGGCLNVGRVVIEIVSEGPFRHALAFGMLGDDPDPADDFGLRFAVTVLTELGGGGATVDQALAGLGPVIRQGIPRLEDPRRGPRATWRCA